MSEEQTATKKFHQQVTLTWLVLFGERLVAAIWQPVVFLMAVFGIFLLDILPYIGFWAHIALLAVIGTFALYLTIGASRKLSWPTRQNALQRLEEVNALEHQPIQNMDVNLGTGQGDAASRVLWGLHKKRLADVTKTVRAKGPVAVLAGADPYALRLIVAVFLIIGFVVAGSDYKERIFASLMPDMAGPVNYKHVKLSAWITPPVYTNMAPIFLPDALTTKNNDTPTIIDAPTGSILTIQLSNAGRMPTLMDGKGVAISFTEDSIQTYSYQQEVTEEDILTVDLKGKILAHWKFFVRPDTPPQISFNGTPLETNRLALHAAYKAYDDYGVEEINLRLRRPPAPGGQETGGIYEYPVIIPGNNREYIDASFLKDLTSHPWAGTQVLLELIAKDAVDNETISMAKLVILPQRVFSHPIAREIIKLRTKLALNPVLKRHKVAIQLGDIGDQPASYNHDIAVHLGIRAAALRLIYPSGDDEVNQVIDLLWDLALRLEDGGLSLAEARLRAAQNAVMEALARGASAEELSRLMDDLEAAMADYMQELVENMLQQEEDTQNTAEGGEELTPQDLKSMLDRIRDLMQMGMKDAAQRMLSEMQKMMENMQAGMPQQATPQGMEALEMMQGLKDIMQGQRELLERSYKQMNQRMENMPTGEGQENVGGSSGEQSTDGMQSSDAMIQQKLREELGDLMQRYQDLMDQQPPALNRADKAMGRAEKALTKGNAARAVQAEGQALDQLQSAARTMQEQFMERFKGEGALGQQLLGESGEGGRDPLGRKAGNDPRNSPEGPGAIPAESDFQKVRSIRDELRRRSGERHRSSDEIDYIDRLLQPF